MTDGAVSPSRMGTWATLPHYSPALTSVPGTQEVGPQGWLEREKEKKGRGGRERKGEGKEERETWEGKGLRDGVGGVGLPLSSSEAQD